MGVERVAGDAAVVDVGDAGTGLGGEFAGRTGSMTTTSGLSESTSTATSGRGYRLLSRAGRDGVQRLGADQMRCESACFGVRLVDPREREIEAAFGDAVRLRVRGQHPLVDAHRCCGREQCGDVLGQPTDIPQPQGRRLRGRAAQPLAGILGEGKDPAGVLQQRSSGLGQRDAAAVADEQLRRRARVRAR